MESNKPLYIPKSKRRKGLTVFCYKCNTNVSDICKKSGKPLSQCKHGEHHVFKVYVFVNGTKNQRKTRKLETRDIDEAIKQAIDFENEVKGKVNEVKSVVKTPNIENKEQPVFLINAMAKYIGWLNNEGVPAHRIKERSSEHIKDIERSFKEFAKCLKNNGYNLNTFTINEMDDNVIGLLYTQMEESGMANRTFNKHIGYFTSFINWYKEQYNPSIKNYFETVSRKVITNNPEAISQKEYEALLKIISSENGVKEYASIEKSFRNVYRPWLKDGIRLGLETGRRREEIINLKWNNIQESEGIKFIKVEDYKVNHIQKRVTEKDKKYVYIPITVSLENLLDELNYKKYKGTDNYILAPEVNIQRDKGMSDILSRGFSHYYNQLKTGRKLTFKCLRKTYITNLEIYMGNGNTKSITGHSDNQVIERNYIDKKEIAKSAMNFEVFSKKVDRSNTLKEIRNKPKINGKEMEIDV